jgi:hypothetical protein
MSTSHTFVVDTTAPTIPAEVSPNSGQIINTGRVNLIWSSSTDTGGVGISGYTYQVSTGSAFSILVKTGFVSTTGVAFTGSDRTYYRRVQAKDRASNTSDRSIGTNFRIDTTKPTASVIYTPASGTWTSGNVMAILT